MNTVVIYKSKYGATRNYAEWISEELNCDIFDSKDVKIQELLGYDNIIYGGGLYAEVINGVSLITKNLSLLKDKKIVVFSVGITPLDYRDYYDGLVVEKNFKSGLPKNVKMFSFIGKMLDSELSLPHRAAIKTLKKIMKAKENPTEMEKLLIKLCDFNGDGCDKSKIIDLVDYIKE